MNDSLEQQVIMALEKLHSKYQRLELLADQILDQSTPVSELDVTMIEMKQQRTEIESLNQQNRSLNEQYQSSRPHASPIVKALTDKIASLMQRLLMKINQLERSAKSVHNKLLPQIHDGVRAVQMKNAYGKHH